MSYQYNADRLLDASRRPLAEELPLPGLLGGGLWLIASEGEQQPASLCTDNQPVTPILTQ